jgi:hypothetical protein
VNRYVLGLMMCAAVGCASDDGEPPPVCGDDTCEPGETAEACPADCVVTCATPCEGDTICVGSQCVAAFERDYWLRLTSGKYTETDRDGVPWDPAGFPDPRVTVCNELLECRISPTREDTLDPVWDSQFPVHVSRSFGFTVFADEVDDGFGLFGWSCDSEALLPDAAVIRSGEVTCAGTGRLSEAWIHFEISPI